MSELIRSTRDVIIRTPDAKAAADFYQHVTLSRLTNRAVIEFRESEPARDALVRILGSPFAIEITGLMKSTSPCTFDANMLD